MIVEDDPPTGALLMRMVKRTWSDVSVILEADPRSALEHWRTVGADLILLDWGLPRMSGLDLLKQIRRSDKKAVCVMITAYSDRDKVLAARACQVDAYITKPFDAKQVMASLSRIMTSHHEPSGSEVAEDSIDDFIKRQVTEGALGLPIDPDLVESIARIREMEADERINIMRRCQADSALLFRLLSLANSHHYMGGTDLVETFDAALRQIGVDGFINLAMELSLFAGSHLKQDFLKAKYLDCQRDAMSLIGVVSKLRQHLEFDVAACRSACLLYRVGELSLLQLMQAWIDDGHVLDEATCASVLSKNAARAGDQLQAQWTLPQPIRERIGAVELLPSGNVKREPIVMRIAGLLHAGDPHQELPRLMARFGLGGSKLGA
ncbi:response regulator [Thiocystis violacea]|nr:response regulator [Thiocystis violacea]MBK1717747.1 response regulator [Thiocystis violacea]